MDADIKQLARNNAEAVKEIKGDIKEIRRDVSYLKETNISQEFTHKELREDVADLKNDALELREMISKVYAAVEGFSELGNLIKGSAKIVGAILVIVSAFWAFMKFVFVNLKF